MNSKIQIHFLGASETVTGSKYLIDTGKNKILVDCGLFQGLKELRLLNWSQLPIRASEIDFVLLTHGHLDHAGYIPRLVKQGFRGKILGSAPTLEITEIILKDSGKIQEEEADRANRGGYSKHNPAVPLYDLKDATESLSYLHPVELDQWKDLGENLRVRFKYNGHILGATYIELDVFGEHFVFSGDIGRPKDILLYPPERPEQADYLFVESTYGNRIHPSDPENQLIEILNETLKNDGTVILPSFAVERTQSLMYLLWKLKSMAKIPNVPMILDSPMGRNVFEVFQTHTKWHKLSPMECSQIWDSFQKTESVKETYKLAEDRSPKIVIAGSGMATGGRVLTYLQYYLEDPNSTILLCGFQAIGTRGRQLQDGNHEIKIYGKFYEVKAKIRSIDGLSSHADQREILHWLGALKQKPKKVFIVHGEKGSSDALRVKLKDTLQFDCEIPKLFEIIELEA
ncbi:MBL fold metallo-hydrolase RNA specificity domain-containing protein [Leptospira kmetyi]|uniref:MBL fold metallo-hydrolase RNA specificity domain-containing protein n=1 Tax=Leptospira kmetyi TaxID=408139 RepID=UPI00108483B7|nr:MBL fold metallo-hydrolase [Leptospira kmetyi]TGK16567.1 MBL fold metallo-hydrolase [Leptospira kmetyi]TGK34030.1 MBL fold metallo-hydrolase [Leptospira kmetyi]